MYCQKCGEENPEDAKFCMHCGADLSGYKVVISPKISVSAKAEGGMALKWKQKPIKYVKVLHILNRLKEHALRTHSIKEGIKLPVYNGEDLSTLSGTLFCPLCGNYDCLGPKSEMGYKDSGGTYLEGLFEVLEEEEKKEVWASYYAFNCLACEQVFLIHRFEEAFLPPKIVSYLMFEGKKLPVYDNVVTRRSVLSAARWKVECTEKERKYILRNYEFKRKDKKKYSNGGWFEYWDLRNRENIQNFLLDKNKNKTGGDSEVILCPVCKRESVKHVITNIDVSFPHSDHDTTVWASNGVVEEYLRRFYTVWECKTCGEFLVFLSEFEKWEEYFDRTPRTYNPCEFCNNAAGIYTCSVCGKRICESCAVKKGRISKKYVCPNCK